VREAWNSYLNAANLFCLKRVLVIDVNDPKAAHINNADDLEKAYPGTVNKTFTFLRDYKVRGCSSVFIFSHLEFRFPPARGPTILRLRGS
jgi:hypothetical protein